MSFVALTAFYLLSSVCCHGANPPPVALNIYCEACCSDCWHFMMGTFKDAFYYKDWTNMTNITFVPAGKSNETYNSDTKQYEFSCQHGSPECDGNLYLACGVAKLYGNDPLKYSPFVIDFLSEVVKEQNGEHDCPNLNMDIVAKTVCDGLASNCDWNILSQCHDSSDGNNIYHQFVSQTHEQAPDLNWVPWIILNGQHNQDEQDECQSNVLQCTCDVYKSEGGQSAAWCLSFQF
eukprot:UN01141